MAMRMALALALVGSSSALALGKTNQTATVQLDMNQIVYVEGQPVLGSGAGTGALKKCSAFVDYMVSDPRKPDVKVCGTGIKMTVFLLGRCGQMSTGRALRIASPWDALRAPTASTPAVRSTTSWNSCTSRGSSSTINTV